jgi:hypothetical protein
MLRLPIILIAIYKHLLYNIAKQYKDNFNNNVSNRHLSITF